MSVKILLVEDDDTLRETLTYNLQRQGYDVSSTANGREGLTMARALQPNLILLDVMLPGIDGIEICRRLRPETSVPILMLTAQTNEIDRVVGLEIGADDYITKPFSMRELMARVKAHLRRTQLIHDEVAAKAQRQIETAQKSKIFGNLTIRHERREMCLNNFPLPLKPKEYDLLYFLAQHRGIALSRDLVLERVWGWTYDGNSRTVDVHVRWLREKIETNPSQPTRIVTVRGIGYRFEG